MPKQTLRERVDNLEAQVAAMRDALQSRDAARRKMLSSEEATRFLGITPASLRQLCHRKKIPYYKPNGKNVYFDVDELVAWQKQNRIEPKGEAPAGEN